MKMKRTVGYSLGVWDPENGAKLACLALDGHKDEVHVLEAHPTLHNIIFSASYDGWMIIWDIALGQALARLA